MAEVPLKRERENSEGDVVQAAREQPSEPQKAKRWTQEQDDALRDAVDKYGNKNWKHIATFVPGRNHSQCLQRWTKVLKPGLVKGHWSYEEDNVLEKMVLQGCHAWGEVAEQIPGRTAKQCRERWRNHLDPSINKGPFTEEEDARLKQAFEQYGNRWTQIAEELPGRTEDAIKQRWRVLYPNQKASTRPGRPRSMPGQSTNRSRATGPPAPSEIARPIQVEDAAMPSHTHSLSALDGSQPYYAHALYTESYEDHAEYALSDGYNYPDPIVHDHETEEVDAKDVAILREFLRSHSSNLLSFGSSRAGNSLSDLSPEELLASGELDDLLRSVSITNRASGTSSARMSGLSTESFSRALRSMGGEEKQMVQDLLDARLSSGSLGFPEVSEAERPVPIADYASTQVLEDDEDYVDPALMRPIRKGVPL